MAEGKIRPGGQVRQRLATSQDIICCRCAWLKLRGRNWMAAAPADRASPVSPASRPSSRMNRLHRPPRRRGDGGGDASSGSAPAVRPAKTLSAGGVRGPGGAHGGTAGGLPDSGPPFSISSRIVTTESYGLPGDPAVPAQAWRPRRGPPAPAYLSVGRERGIDLADPGEHTTADVDRVG